MKDDELIKELERPLIKSFTIYIGIMVSTIFLLWLFL